MAIALDQAGSASTTFQPKDRSQTVPDVGLPDELWHTILECHCTYPPEIFDRVMLNLVKNPNITSSHLFRADIFYDSGNDRVSYDQNHGQLGDGLVKHLKQEYRPVREDVPGFDLRRTIVRHLVPRNPQLDKPLLQTCHFFQRLDDDGEQNVVLYIPHVEKIEDVPFYHPAVSQLAFVHRWRTTASEAFENETAPGHISVSYRLFPNTFLTTKLERTALCLLQTIHKHGQGQLAGYEKRVYHDQVIPQKRFQDTYARLKTKFGKRLSEQWVEVTDPGKHVFEDIGIAAFLIELWQDIYQSPPDAVSDPTNNQSLAKVSLKPPFPGFVDIGCGNGLLVYILSEEGYDGWGFDARERKTWSTFPDRVRSRLHRNLLVPIIFQSATNDVDQSIWHNGIFGPGAFIISNHADELTAWTPLLAYLNQSSFIAIPCCSHDLTGARFRAPHSTRAMKQAPARLPQQPQTQESSEESNGTIKQAQAAETGSLKRTDAQKKMSSAYSSLCSYVASLAEEVGFEPEKEVLRIPSTRNQCIIGRQKTSRDTNDRDGREQKVVDIVERELGRRVEAVGSDWVERAHKIAKKPGSGH